MNTFVILTFVHDEDKVFVNNFYINFLYYLFEFHLYCIMLVTKFCMNAYVRK